MSFDFAVRESVRADCSQLTELIREHAREENSQFLNSPDNLLLDGGYEEGQEKFYECFVAHLEGSERIIGYLTYNMIYSSWDQKLVFVDEIYVKERFRRRGVGVKLWTTLIQKMTESGCEKLHIMGKEDDRAFCHFVVKNGCTDYTQKDGWRVYAISADTFNGKESN
jgi:diamine acetyltransferase 1